MTRIGTDFFHWFSLPSFCIFLMNPISYKFQYRLIIIQFGTIRSHRSDKWGLAWDQIQSHFPFVERLLNFNLIHLHKKEQTYLLLISNIRRRLKLQSTAALCTDPFQSDMVCTCSTNLLTWNNFSTSLFDLFQSWAKIPVFWFGHNFVWGKNSHFVERWWFIFLAWYSSANDFKFLKLKHDKPKSKTNKTRVIKKT